MAKSYRKSHRKSSKSRRHRQKQRTSRKSYKKSKRTRRSSRRKQMGGKKRRHRQSGGDGYFLDLEQAHIGGQAVRQGYSECCPPAFQDGHVVRTDAGQAYCA